MNSGKTNNFVLPFTVYYNKPVCENHELHVNLKSLIEEFETIKKDFNQPDLTFEQFLDSEFYDNLDYYIDPYIEYINDYYDDCRRDIVADIDNFVDEILKAYKEYDSDSKSTVCNND